MFYVKIPDKKECSFNGDIIKIEDKDFFHIPLVIGRDENLTVLVKKGDKVLKGQAIAHTKGSFKTNVISSITGEVVGFEEKLYLNNKKVRCAVIKNSYAEDIEEAKNKVINKLTKEEFINMLKEGGIVGLGGAAFPAHVKFSTDVQINTLIVNAVECESYVTADQKILLSKIEEILEAIDAILEIFDIPEAIIAVKSRNSKLRDAIEDFVGTYLKIRIETVKDHYTTGYEKNIIKEIKNVECENIPLEQGIIVNNVSTIYSIYELLKKNKPLYERMVTITGSGVNKPCNVIVKSGMLVKDVINDIGGYASDEVVLVAGGPMMGESVSSDDLAISPNLNTILVLKDYEQEEETDCFNCGRCTKYCTVKISPVLIKNNIDDIEALKLLRPEKCVECGLCSYICPAKIPIREYVKKAKMKMEA